MLMASVSAIGLIPFTLDSNQALLLGSFAPKGSLSSPSSAQAVTSPMMAMPLVVPLFIQNEDFSSTLVLTNSADQATYADVILTGTNGREITRRRVEFTAHSQRDIEVAPLLQSVLSSSTTGSISVIQSPDLRGAVILGQLSMTYRGTHDPTYIDEEVSMPMTMGSQMLRGVADPGSGSPLLAITSLSETGQRVAIQCFPSEGKSSSKSVDLMQGETLLTEACAERTIHGAVMESFATPEPPEHQSPTGPIGISLASDAKPGSFVAFGLAPHRKDGERFFSSVNFSDPKMLLTATTIFTGVPVGPTTLLPEANYVPNLSLANFSSKDLQVHVQYVQTSGTAPTTKEIAAVTVPAGSSKAITLDSLQGDPQLQNSFVITSNGAPGDLLSKLVSKSDSALRQVEIVGKDENDLNNTGNHPWSLEDGTESTLLLFNHTTKPQSFNVAISGNGVRWQSTYHLIPMQTEAISIRDLIEHQVKDENGKTLPRSAQSGQLSWFTGAPGQGKGRILQSNRTAAMARNFSCGAPGGLCSASFHPTTPIFPVGSSAVNFGTAYGIECTADPNNPQPCFGTFTGPASGFLYQWSSNDTNIITIDHSTTDATSSTVYVNGVAGGSTGVHAFISDSQGCYQSAGTVGTVQVPTSLQVLSDTKIIDMSYGGVGCSNSGSYGIEIAIHYQVLDQNGSPINSTSMEPQEKDPALGMNNWADLGPSPYPGTSQFTDANGQFWDAPLGTCGPSSFSMNDTQYISILLNQHLYPLNGFAKTNNWTTSSSSVGHGSITNGADISKSR